MKKTLGILFALALAGSAAATTLTGKIVYASGKPVNGTLSLAPNIRANILNVPTACGGPGAVSPVNPLKIRISGGSPPAGASVTGNDCLSPAMTYYAARLVDNGGTVVLDEYWRVTGASVDIGEILGVPNPIAPPLALNGDVTGDVTQSIVQRLQGQPLDATTPVQGNILLYDTGHWKPGSVAGTGTVTSVGFTAPTQFTVTGAPITAGGTIALAWADAIQNGVLAGPVSGGAGPPVFRALDPADIPAIPESGVTGLVADLAAKVPATRLISAGTGLAGGGDLSTNRTISVPPGGISDSMLASPADSANTPSTIVKRDGSGNFAAGTITANLTGNATNVTGTVAIANGGTGQASASAAFNALAPLTSTGDTLYESGPNTAARLAGNASVTNKFLTQSGNAVTPNPPAWGTIAAGDVPNIAESQVTNLPGDLAARVATTFNLITSGPLTGGGTLGGASLTLAISPCVASGVGHAAGAVPDPGAVGGTTRFLREDCTWVAPGGGGGIGTVTSVGITDATGILTVAGSPVTTSGAITLGLGSQSGNLGFFSPDGAPGAPSFRSMVAADVPALPESKITNLTTDLAAKVAATRQIITTAPLGGGGDLSADRTLTISNFTNSTAGAVPASGGDATKFLSADTTFKTAATSVGLAMPGDFSVANSPVTTSGTLTVTRANQTANTILAGPTTGAAAPPTYRAQVVADLPANIPESQIQNLSTDLTARALTATNINTTAPLAGGGSLAADRTLSLTLNGGGCLSPSGGLGIGSGCITDAMLSPTTGFVKRDGSTQLTNSWNIGPQNLGLNEPTPIFGWHQLGGGMRLEAVATPGAPTVTPQGTPGGTTYTYQLVAIDHNGGKTLVGPTGTTTTGNATLTSVNFNRITWTAVPGASTYDVLINGTSTSVATNISTAFFDDQGGTQAPYTPPIRNTTADLTVDGLLTAAVAFGGPINIPGSVTATQFISNIATGTAPLVVSSTTPVANLTLLNDSQLPTISTAGKVSNSATTGTSANSPNTLVLRDGSGNFSAGTITANVTGNITGNATNFTGSLAGDVTGTQGATVVATVGGSTAANVHAADVAVQAATNLDDVGTIVKRDGSGNFAGGIISASSYVSSVATGTAPFTVSSTTPVANLTLSIDAQVPTLITAGKVHDSATTATSANTPSTIVERDGSGNFAAGAITGTQLISNIATGTAPLAVTSTTAVANLTLSADSQLPTISTAGKVQNTATTGTATNTPSTLVLRDGSGNFAAGNVTGTQFIGPATAMSVNGGAAQVDFTGSPVPSAGYLLIATDATHAHFANVTATGSVPTSRVINATPPMLIDGGASADLSADRTLSVAVTAANDGGAIAKQSIVGVPTIQTGQAAVGRGIFTGDLAGTDPALGLGSCMSGFSPTGSYLIDAVSDTTGCTAARTVETMGIEGKPSGISTTSPGFAFRSYNGSYGAKTATSSGQVLMALNAYGYGTTTFANPGAASAGILAKAIENFTDTAHGSKLQINITTPGSGAPTAALELRGDANAATGSGSATFDGPVAVALGNSFTVPNPQLALDVRGPIATRHSNVTLANGANVDTIVPFTSFLRIVGPTGAFSTCGFVNGAATAPQDGQVLRVFNTVSQTWTITNEGAGCTAAYRITTLTGADVVMRTTAPSFANFVYDSVASRWILTSIN